LPTEPFSYRRRVAFGECDPARIYFAPRAVDYAVEAVEAWFESVLGISWAGLVGGHGLEATFRRVECEFLRPLIAGQVVRVRLRVAGVAPSRLTFLAAGEGSSGEECFRVRLEGILAGRDGWTPVPIPAEYLARVEAYRSGCGEGEDPGPAPGETDLPPPGKVQAAGAVPFTRQHRVLYGECGVSGRIYAPKVLDFIVEAIGEWFEEIPRVSWLELVSERRQGAPWVSAACDYLRSMVPGHVITMTIRVPRLGRTSVGFAVTGHDAGGAPCFASRWTACFIDQDSGFRPMPVPEEFRARIQAYREACEAAG
jgi:acyl-CoA thioesterase FadM